MSCSAAFAGAERLGMMWSMYLGDGSRRKSDNALDADGGDASYDKLPHHVAELERLLSYGSSFL